MRKKIMKVNSDWKDITELREIDTDISSFGYSREYIESNKLDRMLEPHASDEINGRVCFYEQLEVKLRNNIVMYRENYQYEYPDIPDKFATQYGTFNNHNHGEFTSWLGRDDYDGLSEKEKQVNHAFGRDDFYVEGNFYDMFDCGDYSYAISNTMHMGLGYFKIVRIDENIVPTVMYDNSEAKDGPRLEYMCRCSDENGNIVIASGYVPTEGNYRHSKPLTVLFRIDYDGNCNVDKEFEVVIPSANSFVRMGAYVFFGNNKMISRLNVNTGELKYFTNKSDEELADLKSIW